MPCFYFKNEGRTLASALRTALEEIVCERDFVSCDVVHPLDSHVEVEAPDEATVRMALLNIKERIRLSRGIRPRTQRTEHE